MQTACVVLDLVKVAMTVVPAVLYMTRQDEQEDHAQTGCGKRSSAAGVQHLPASQRPGFRRLSYLMGTVKSATVLEE